MRYPVAYFLLVMAMIASSCVAKKTLLGDNPAGSKEIEATLEYLASTEVPYEYFSGQGQGRIDWDDERYSVRFNVRIKKDSVIWMVISKLGFEVGRMLVTPDSAFFINRLERTFSKYKTEDFLHEYNVPANFDMFTKVFTAGAYIPPGTGQVIQEADGSILVKGNGVEAQHWFDAALLSKSLIIDETDHEWTAGFSDYRKAETGQVFPFLRTNMVLIDGKSNVFDLEYTNVAIDVPLDFPFSIPSHYEKE